MMATDGPAWPDEPCLVCGRSDLCGICTLLECAWKVEMIFAQLASACPALPARTVDAARHAYSDGGLFTLLDPILRNAE